jgi:hypothetical protein
MPLGVSFEPFAALACCESLPRHPPTPPKRPSGKARGARSDSRGIRLETGYTPNNVVDNLAMHIIDLWSFARTTMTLPPENVPHIAL